MDLERSLAGIKIDENPWRSQHGETPQPWAQMPGGANNQAWGGGHMSPQQMRNPWPENNLAQNVNEALGIAGPGVPGTWGTPMAGPGEFADPAKIWSDPNHEQQQFQPMHNHHIPGGMNGMMDPQAGDWMSVPSQSQQPMWSDPMKQEQEGFWKQPHQQQGWNGPPGNMGGGAGFRMPPQHGRRGGPQPPMGMHVPMRVPPGAWNPGNMYPPVRQQGPNDHGNWNRGGMARGMGGGRAYPGGVELNMSVPPPMDMQMGIRQMPPTGSLWKQDQMGGAPNGMRPNPYGQMAAPFGMPSKPQGPGQFPIAGADDLMWHDPNGDLKKWQRDTGVSLWGDPEKYERPIRNWLVPEGEEEDLEAALSKCPVPQKRVQNEDGSARLPFTLPSKRSIVVTGWGELPENDPNNPVKPEDMPSSSKWGEMTPIPYNDAPWNLPGQQPAPFVPEAGAWGQPPGAGGNIMPAQNAGGLGGDPSITAQKAEQLRQACEKGYIDMSCLDSSVLVHTNLPNGVLEDIRALLDKIPQLESVEQEMNQLVESVRPEGETDGGSPQRWMNEVQKVEHDRLIIAVTTAKIEVTNLSKKINSYLAETGMGSQEGARGDGYRYPFIE